MTEQDCRRTNFDIAIAPTPHLMSATVKKPEPGMDRTR